MAYVQGARRPGGAAARYLASELFASGFHVTSGYRCSGSYHGCGPGTGRGDALDLGDSVNDLRRVWDVLWPHRSQLPELLGPWGLYRYGRRFYHSRLQAQHRDHVHVAVLTTINLRPRAPTRPRFWYMTKAERAHALNLEARRRTARRHGGWNRIGSEHLRSAERSKRFLVRANERVHAAARQSGWDRQNRRLRHQAFHKLIT